MSVGGLSNYGFSFDKSSAKTNANSGLANALFGNKNSLYTDYSLIKSGAYKKLLTAYYNQQKDEQAKSTTSAKKVADTKSVSDKADTTKKAETTGTDTKAAENKKTTESDVNLAAKASANNLKTSASALKGRSLYQSTGTDEAGNAVYDREKITKSVKNFVSDYNKMLTSGADSTAKRMGSRLSSMTNATAVNEKALKEIGIQIGEDGQLTLDEKKLSEASVSKISSLFQGSGSYADTVAGKAESMAKLAESAANTASSYSSSGSYQKVNASTLLDQYM